MLRENRVDIRMGMADDLYTERTVFIETSPIGEFVADIINIVDSIRGKHDIDCEALERKGIWKRDRSSKFGSVKVNVYGGLIVNVGSGLTSRSLLYLSSSIEHTEATTRRTLA